MIAATSSGDANTLYVVILVILGFITAGIIPLIGYVFKTVVSQLRSNTQETEHLAQTVSGIAVTQRAMQRDIDRHERLLERR